MPGARVWVPFLASRPWPGIHMLGDTTHGTGRLHYFDHDHTNWKCR